MSKPLELTIHPPVPYRSSSAWARLPWNHPDVRALMRADEKRLTEAELAAEWWRADQRFQNSTEGTETELRSLVELATLHRFATRPHYFEATEPESDTE